MKKTRIFTGMLLACILPALYGQQYNSVPLDHGAYRLIELGALRGLVTLPSAAKPWPETTVRQKLAELLGAEGSALSGTERRITQELLAGFERNPGWNPDRGAWYREHGAPGETRYSLEAGLSWKSGFSLSPFPDPAWETAQRGTLFVAGDMGRFFSYNFTARGGVFRVARRELGSDPLAFGGMGRPVYAIPSSFPYGFTKAWDGAVFKPASLGSYDGWPDTFSFGYEIISELNASLAADRLFFRFGRMRRDWGPGMGASLVLNAQARPLIALEGSARLSEGIRFSFLTGIPEYLKIRNQKGDAAAWQNAFSLALLEFSSPYAHFDLGSAAIWPKRFELGYLFPANSNFFYQNNVGDFDNLALFANLEGRWPGVGKVRFSFFLDEANFTYKPFFNLDRQMYACQGGLDLRLPWLPFGNLSFRYTKIEPFCYTHPATEVPWNTQKAQTAYLNNGESLGYYLPPNTDEFLLRGSALFFPGGPLGETETYLQYQLIRHGLEYGPGRVDGSSPADELVYDDFTTKYFLRDGAYRWDNVIKLGASCRVRVFDFPVRIFAEAGLVLTRYSLNQAPPGADTPYAFLSPGDPDYRSAESLILALGFQVFE
jgi:hypothetical protein